MIENDNNIWEVITSVLNGSVNDEEKAILSSWLEEKEVNRKTFDLILNTGIREKQYPSQIKLKVFSQVQNEMMKRKLQGRVQLWRYCAVASVALILVMSYFFMKENLSSSETYVKTYCPFGNKSQILLNDGTIVFLNSGSSLSYPGRFKGDYRRVILMGEAYFDVKKDSKHPFIVETGDVKIRVYGTRFNVKNYEEENTIETTLMEGSVGLFKRLGSNFKETLKLSPNQQAIYSKSSGALEKRAIDAELSVIWKDGKYYFEKELFSSIVRKLERNFNVNIRISSESLNRRVFSGMIDKNRNIFQTLDIMKRYSRFDYNLRNDTIIVTNTTMR
jgi:transmembrane sensor